MMPDGGPDAVGADQRQRHFLLPGHAAALHHGQPLRMGGGILELATKSQLDIGMVIDMGLQRGLQIGPVHHPIGSAGAQRGGFAERQPGDFAAASRTHDADGVRRDGAAGQSRFEPETDQHAACIGRQLQSGAGFLEALGALQNDDAKALSRQRQRRRQSSDSGAGDQDRA